MSNAHWVSYTWVINYDWVYHDLHPITISDHSITHTIFKILNSLASLSDQPYIIIISVNLNFVGKKPIYFKDDVFNWYHQLRCKIWNNVELYISITQRFKMFFFFWKKDNCFFLFKTFE